MEKMRKYEFNGFFIITAISLLLVLTFLFTDVEHVILRWFLPINNSLWEMGKLMFTAVFIYSIIELLVFGKKYRNFLFAKAATLFIAPLFYIVGSYYSDLLLGGAYSSFHILIFIISVGLGQYISYYFLDRGYFFKLMNFYGVLGILIMMFMYFNYSNSRMYYDSPFFEPMKSYEKHILYQK